MPDVLTGWSTQHKKYFVNVPSYMSWMFWAAKPFLSATSFARLEMVSGGTPEAIGRTLLLSIDGNQLPSRYGGLAEVDSSSWEDVD